MYKCPHADRSRREAARLRCMGVGEAFRDLGGSATSLSISVPAFISPLFRSLAQVVEGDRQADRILVTYKQSDLSTRCSIPSVHRRVIASRCTNACHGRGWISTVWLRCGAPRLIPRPARFYDATMQSTEVASRRRTPGPWRSRLGGRCVAAHSHCADVPAAGRDRCLGVGSTSLGSYRWGNLG